MNIQSQAIQNYIIWIDCTPGTLLWIEYINLQNILALKLIPIVLLCKGTGMGNKCSGVPTFLIYFIVKPDDMYFDDPLQKGIQFLQVLKLLSQHAARGDINNNLLFSSLPQQQKIENSDASHFFQSHLVLVVS